METAGLNVEVHKNDQELAKGHGYQILGRAKNPRRNKLIKSVRRANEAASNIVTN